MTAEISSQPQNDYLVIKASGTIENLEELKDLSVRFYKEAIKYETRKVVIDEMELRLTNSIFHQVELIKFYSENLPTEIRDYKLAVAVDPQYKELAEFWNLYGSNRGYSWKGFTSLEEALNWIRLTDE